MAIENDSDGNPIFIGEAKAGVGKASNAWRIKKIIIDSDKAIVDILWADGTAEFDKVWNDRATFTYS